MSASGEAALPSAMRRLSADQRARVPFALVAAIILLLAGVSAVFLTTANRDALIAQRERLGVESLDRAAETVRDEVESQAYYAAMRSVALALLNGTGPGSEDDEQLINETFQGFFEEYVAKRFPITEGDVVVELRGWVADVFYDQKLGHDLVPASGVEDTYDDVDSSQEYANRVKGNPDKLSNKVGGELREVNTTAYYRVTGQMNLTLTESGRDLTLSKSIRFDRVVDNTYPFLKTKFKNFMTGGDGTNSEVARMTKFILTTVAQYRALQGYGMMNIPKMRNMTGEIKVDTKLENFTETYPGTTDQILTMKDVELAVNLALLLTVAKHYRTYDADVPAAIDSGYAIGGPQFPKRSDLTMQDLLDTYVDSGTIDSADIVALYTGMGSNDTFEINLEAIVAQGFYVIIDQFILKFLDYFMILPILDVLWKGLQVVWNFINDIVETVSCWFTDCDPDWYDDLLRPFLRETGKKAGLGSNGLFNLMVRDRSGSQRNSYRGNVIDSYPRRDIVEGPYYLEWVVRQTADNHTLYKNWSESTPHTGYNASHTNDTFVAYEYVTYNMTVYADSPNREILFSPVNTDSKSSIWRAFYDAYYDTGSGDSKIESIRETVVRVVTEVADHVVGMVKHLVWDHRFLLESTVPLQKGRTPINPEDKTSFLREISREVEYALNDIFNYYRNHKDLVKQLVKELIDDTIAMYRSLRDTIRVNYDVFTGWPSQRASVVHNLANQVVFSNLSMKDAVPGSFLSGASPFDATVADFDTSMMTPQVVQELFRVGNVNGTGSYMDDLRARLIDDVDSAYGDLKDREVMDLDPAEVAVNENDGVIMQGMDYLMFDDVNGIAGMIVNAIADALGSVMHGTGLIDLIRDFIVGVARSTIYNSEAANSEYFQPTEMGAPFDFYVGGRSEALERKTVRYESLYLEQDDDYLEAIAEPIPGTPRHGQLSVDIHDRTGVHYTNVWEISRRPYETVWNVSVLGEVDFSTRTESRSILGVGTDSHQWYNDTVQLGFSINVVIFSGWPLEGVDYELSNTFIGDLIELVLRLFKEVWDVIADPIMDVIDFFAKVVAFFQDVIGTLIKFAMQIVKLVIDAIDFVVSLIQKFIKFILNSVLGWIAEAIGKLVGWINDLWDALFGTPLTIPIFGLYLSFIAGKDTDPKKLGVQLKGDLFGADVNFEVALYKFPQAIRDSKWDVLAHGNITVGDGTFITIRMDPLMLVFPHIAELHITSMNNKGNGWGFDWYMPFLEEYKEIGWALSDVIGWKPTIPIPPLGLEASVDLGVKIKYHSPMVDHLAINEFEMNPDNGSQWVELINLEWCPYGDYNQCLQGKSLDGYTLRSADSDELYAFSAGESMPWRTAAGPSYLAVNVTGLAKPPSWTWTIQIDEILNQIGEMKDYYVDPGDGVFLYDPNENIVDQTPLRKDDKVFAFVFEGVSWGDWDADWTYHREYDGGPLWVLGNATRGDSNPGEKTLDIKRLVLGALKDSFLETWFELEDRMAFSLDFIGEFIKTVIVKFIDKVLDLIEKIVIEVIFYVDIAISPFGSQGAAGGGFRLSFVIEGEGLAALLRWLVDVLEVFVHNITTPNNPQAYPSIPRAVPEHMFIRLEGYLMVGVPASVRGAVPESMAGDVPTQVVFVVLIQANLPLFAALIGKDWGRWRLDFGVYIEGFPAKIADTLWGYKAEEGAKINLWLIKVSIYEIRGGL